LDSLLVLPEPGESVGRLNVIQQLQCKLIILQTSDDNILALFDLSEIEHEIEESEQIKAKVLDYDMQVNRYYVNKVKDRG